MHEFKQAPSASISLGVAVSDATDIPILASAIAAKANVFVAGDKALFDLKKVENILILSPRQL